jgi:hypothetical protein
MDKKSSSLAEHEGKYLVAVQKGAGLVYITAHRPAVAADALNAAASMVRPDPKDRGKNRVFVLRVLAEVKNPMPPPKGVS